MVFTTHAITGAAIGLATGNPILAFVFGFLSHFILDSIPHFDQGSFYMDKDKGPAWLGAKYEESKEKFKTGKRDWIILFFDFAVAGAIGLCLLFYVPMNCWLLLILGGLGGILPDVFDGSPWRYKFRKLKFGKIFHKFHNFFHWPLSMKYFYFGFLIQVVIVAIGLFLMLH